MTKSLEERILDAINSLATITKTNIEDIRKLEEGQKTLSVALVELSNVITLHSKALKELLALKAVLVKAASSRADSELPSINKPSTTGKSN